MNRIQFGYIFTYDLMHVHVFLLAKSYFKNIYFVIICHSHVPIRKTFGHNSFMHAIPSYDCECNSITHM
jgi:hypothetical protein